jgi:hypothetical protein
MVMRTHPALLESLEGRRLFSVSIASITGVSAVPGTPPDTAVRRENFTLTAHGDTASAGDKVTSVTYFVDRNGNGVPDRGDTIIGRSRNFETHFSVTKRIKPTTAVGTLAVSAVATGRLGKSDVSAPVTDHVTVVDPAPGIRNLTTSVVRRRAGLEKVTVVASGVTDLDGKITRVEFYNDVNANGVLDAGDAFLGTGRRAGKRGTWKFDASTSVAGAPRGARFTFLARAVDDSNAVSAVSTPAFATV